MIWIFAMDTKETDTDDLPQLSDRMTFLPNKEKLESRSCQSLTPRSNRGTIDNNGVMVGFQAFLSMTNRETNHCW